MILPIRIAKNHFVVRHIASRLTDRLNTLTALTDNFQIVKAINVIRRRSIPMATKVPRSGNGSSKTKCGSPFAVEKSGDITGNIQKTIVNRKNLFPSLIIAKVYILIP